MDLETQVTIFDANTNLHTLLTFHIQLNFHRILTYIVTDDTFIWAFLVSLYILIGEVVHAGQNYKNIMNAHQKGSEYVTTMKLMAILWHFICGQSYEGLVFDEGITNIRSCKQHLLINHAG